MSECPADSEFGSFSSPTYSKLGICKIVKGAYQMILFLKSVFSALIVKFSKQKNQNFSFWKN